MKHSDDELSFIRSIPHGIIEEFQAETYQESYVENHPKKFIGTAWIDVDDFKTFIQARKERPPTRIKHVSDASDASKPPKRVKIEHVSSPKLVVKSEPNSISIDNPQIPPYRSVMEDGREILELLSSDDEMELDCPTKIDDGMSSDTLFEGVGQESDDEVEILEQDSPLLLAHNSMSNNSSKSNSGHSDAKSEPDNNNDLGPTVWLDEDVTSRVEYGFVQLTRERSVDCIEFVLGLPSYYPIPRSLKKAYVVDVTNPKYNTNDKDGNLLPVDALIKNSDQDSWTGCTGGGANDSCPLLTIFNGRPERCRRSRLQCAGCSVCEHIHPALINQERYELNPESLAEVLKIQLDARVQEADTPEKLALIFFSVCHSTACKAKDEQGQTCTGTPVLRAYNNGPKGGHRYFVSCSQWSSRFRDNHRTAYIPSGIRDSDLVCLFNGENIPGFEIPCPCGRIVPAHIGARAKYCKFPHQGDGSRARLIRLECTACRTIFVPLDPMIRMACILPNPDRPHTHPVLPATKASTFIRETYKLCVKSAGIIGSSVRTVDNAQTTKMILGQAPSTFAPALQNNRVKQEIIRAVKKESYRYGTDLPGVIHLMNEDLPKPLDSRYIHSYATTQNGGKILLTANPYLLKRIHLADTLFVDTTFKRTVGPLKEWEAVMWDREVQRAVTVCRIYSDRADRVQYKMIFDELQRVTVMVTGRPLRLKRLSKEGTLITVGVDMELAQALGAGDSFLHTNEPEYSKIHVKTAEEIVEYFVRSCYTHAKRGIHDLKGSVTEAEYRRIINFMYLETKEEVDGFSKWVENLNNRKVQAWWAHKTNNSWILPSRVKCLSKMDPDDWDCTAPTTNIGEAQHHWTNINTGISLSLLEAILIARECDEKVAAEINGALATGILKNHRNDAFTLMSRSTARTTNAYKKVRETRDRNNAHSMVDQEIQSLANAQKENAAKLKDLKATKRDIGRGKASKAESSSSGKVKLTSKEEKEKAASKIATLQKALIYRSRPASPLKQADAAISTLTEQDLLNDMDASDAAANYFWEDPLAEMPLLDMTAAANLYAYNAASGGEAADFPPHPTNLFTMADLAMAEALEGIGGPGGTMSDFDVVGAQYVPPMLWQGAGEDGFQVTDGSEEVLDRFLQQYGGVEM